jgi:hypothetical protein
LRSDLEGLRRRTEAKPGDGFGGKLVTEVGSLALLLDDRRFGEGVEAASAAPNPLQALSELAREYARVPFRTGWKDGGAADLMSDRAAEIEDLCVLVHVAMSGRPMVRAGSIVVGEQLRAFLALSAFVIEDELPEDGIVAEIVRAAGRPFLTRVKGVFSWVRPGDLLVVDAETSSVRINPGATAVARFRTRRS